MSINEKNQVLTSYDILKCLMAMAVLALLIFPAISKEANPLTKKQAKMTAEKIGEDLIAAINMPKNDASSRSYKQERQLRGLASAEDISALPIKMEGLKGSDPWGNPYHYRILKDLYGKPTHLVVWSRGANAIQDTSEFDFHPDQGKVDFHGDDIGYISKLIPSKY